MRDYRMRNPFQYGGVVGPEAFCNRKRELADLTRVMENGDRIFVYSERRLGKTSVVRLALSRLPRKQFVSAYIDLWPTDGEQSFVTTVARALTESMSGTVDRMLETARTLFSHLSPRITVDNQGRPAISFGLESPQRITTGIEEVLEAPARIARRGQRRVVIVFDEFQRILEYGSDTVERRLRGIIQSQKHVAYLFLGSRKHLIQKMFLDKSRPLYRAAGHYPIGTIAEEAWRPFIRRRFAEGRKGITDAQVHEICALTQGHPFYTQHLCHTLWDACDPGKALRQDSIQRALRLLLLREDYAYSILWESLTRNQQRLLRAIAGEEKVQRIFSAEFIAKHDLGSASSTQRAVESLLEKDIIDRERGSFIIPDRFFRLWVREVEAGDREGPLITHSA
jgi:AAA+ ATPase superfamily predicted ATPase